MKHLKLYEQYDFDDLSDEELFGENKGPYDNILKYGNDGPDFKCGDRVRLTEKGRRYFISKLSDGTIVDYDGAKYYLVCFDNFFSYGHAGCKGNDFYNMPDGHGYWVEEYYLESV